MISVELPPNILPVVFFHSSLSFVLVLCVVAVTNQDGLKAAQGRTVQPPQLAKEQEKGARKQLHAVAYDPTLSTEVAYCEPVRQKRRCHDTRLTAITSSEPGMWYSACRTEESEFTELVPLPSLRRAHHHNSNSSQQEEGPSPQPNDRHACAAQVVSLMLGHKERKLCPGRDSLWRLVLASENTLTQGYALGTPNGKCMSPERLYLMGSAAESSKPGPQDSLSFAETSHSPAPTALAPMQLSIQSNILKTHAEFGWFTSQNHEDPNW